MMVLPDPFGPTRPTTWPWATSRSRPSTARIPLRSRLVSCSIRMAGGGSAAFNGSAWSGSIGVPTIEGLLFAARDHRRQIHDAGPRWRVRVN